METSRLALLPRDGFFFKDGRGWYSSASEYGHSLEWPWPSTLLGAMRTLWGRAEEARTGNRFTPRDWREKTEEIFIQRTLALRRPHAETWNTTHRVWPRPADALSLESEAGGMESLDRLDPKPPRGMTLGRDDDAAREALWMPYPEQKRKPRRGARWWGESAFARWLVGEVPQGEEMREAFNLQRRRQVRVSIDPARHTVSDGAIFSQDVVEALERDAEWALGIETNCQIADDHLATLGSDRRLAYVESLDDALFAMPMLLRKASVSGSRGLRLVVVTPACFENGWLPDGFAPDGEQYRGRLRGLEAELILRSALVDRPIAVSGWDMVAGQPKQTAQMVSAGAVYFFERADELAFTAAQIEALWLTALGGRTNEGFGRIVPALWNPQPNGA